MSASFFDNAFDNAAKAISSAKKAKNAISIYVDLKAQTVHFFLMPLGDKSALSYEAHTFRSRSFDQNFFKALTDMTSAYSSAHPEVAESDITLVLPDYLFATDIATLPTLSRRKMDASLEVLLDNLYKNREELEINTMLAQSGKKSSTYSVAILSRSIRASFVAACNAGKMTLDCITFRSSAYANAVAMIDSKYAGASYLMLDIRQSESTVIFVVKGRAAGFYPLPFGYKILQRASVVAENLLFDHDTAELIVLNAKEKAKAKQLTMMRTSDASEDGADVSSLPENPMLVSDDPTAGSANTTTKELPRKMARNVPKFMQRPTPHTPEEVTYENFTIFMKWALNLLDSNDKLTTLGEPDTILVNLPDDCAHVIDTANEEREENGISFTRLGVARETENIREHIELYGGLYAPGMNKINNF